MPEGIQPEKTKEKHRPPHLFKPGQSGNPNGRPKGSGISITTAIKKELEKVPKGQTATYLELIVKRILKNAIEDGDQNAIKQIWNYIDGMPKQSIETTISDDRTKDKLDSLIESLNGQGKSGNQ